MNQECNYGFCDKDATTYGYVFTRDKELVLVHACDEHKKVSGFFEGRPEDENNNQG